MKWDASGITVHFVRPLFLPLPHPSPFSTQHMKPLQTDTSPPLARVRLVQFPREAIPDDIKADQPTPEKWGRPMGHFPSTSCNPYQFFKDNFAILNLTFCGDWAAGYGRCLFACQAAKVLTPCVAFSQCLARGRVRGTGPELRGQDGL